MLKFHVKSSLLQNLIIHKLQPVFFVLNFFVTFLCNISNHSCNFNYSRTRLQEDGWDCQILLVIFGPRCMQADKVSCF